MYEFKVTCQGERKYSVARYRNDTEEYPEYVGPFLTRKQASEVAKALNSAYTLGALSTASADRERIVYLRRH